MLVTRIRSSRRLSFVVFAVLAFLSWMIAFGSGLSEERRMLHLSQNRMTGYFMEDWLGIWTRVASLLLVPIVTWFSRKAYIDPVKGWVSAQRAVLYYLFCTGVIIAGVVSVRFILPAFLVSEAIDLTFFFIGWASMWLGFRRVWAGVAAVLLLPFAWTLIEDLSYSSTFAHVAFCALLAGIGVLEAFNQRRMVTHHELTA